jgi:hypothetical protein
MSNTAAEDFDLDRSLNSRMSSSSSSSSSMVSSGEVNCWLFVLNCQKSSFPKEYDMDLCSLYSGSTDTSGSMGTDAISG